MRFLECKNLVLRFSLRSKIYLYINFEYKFSLLLMDFKIKPDNNSLNLLT